MNRELELLDRIRGEHRGLRSERRGERLEVAPQRLRLGTEESRSKGRHAGGEERGKVAIRQGVSCL